MFKKLKEKKRIGLLIDKQLKSNNSLGDGFRNSLITDAKEFKIKETYIEKILSEKISEHFSTFVTPLFADKIIDDEEKLMILDEVKRLDIAVEAVPILELVEQYNVYHKILTEDINPIHVNINLKKGEECYYESICDWNEFRKVTKGVQYAGPQARIKIAKGVYYRIGQYNGRRITSDEMKKIDSGTIFFTNKRVVFMGAFGNKSINLSSIFTLEEYSDGLYIQKDTGRSPFLSKLNDQRKANLILSKVIQQ